MGAGVFVRACAGVAREGGSVWCTGVWVRGCGAWCVSVKGAEFHSSSFFAFFFKSLESLQKKLSQTPGGVFSFF